MKRGRKLIVAVAAEEEAEAETTIPAMPASPANLAGNSPTAQHAWIEKAAARFPITIKMIV
jgi:hypothetical protein